MVFARVLFPIWLCLLGACSVRHHESGVLFDKLKGRGPIRIEPTNQSIASTHFFHDTWMSSASIKHLVTQRGTPAAISTEREFLKPSRLKLFYPTQGQVYVFDLLDGEWLVSGSEPMLTEELEQLARQSKQDVPAAVETVPVTFTAAPVSPPPPVARVSPADFRGRLKPPSEAVVAKLSMKPDRSYVHTVSFAGEDLTVLADWYTDSPRNAEHLAIANKRSIRRPLHLGDEILIPRAMMVNPEPLPEAMVP